MSNANPTSKRSGGSVAKAGVNLFKKLVYDNYDEPTTDRRGAEREDSVGEVLVKVVANAGQPELETRAFVRNTSRSGCGLWCRQPIAVGATLMISGLAGQTKDMPQR